MAQLVKHLTLDCSSDHDLVVRGIEPRVGPCADSMEPAWDSLSPSLSLCPSPAHVRSLCTRLCLSKTNNMKKLIF